VSLAEVRCGRAAEDGDSEMDARYGGGEGTGARDLTCGPRLAMRLTWRCRKRCRSGVGMLRILPAARVGFDGIAGRILRPLGVHGAVVSAVTAATCGQRDIIAQTEGE
jgi:hypothetical protein